VSSRPSNQGLSRRDLFAAAAAWWVLSCGADSTTGREVVLRTRATSESVLGSPFTTETGWTITLSKAVLSVGALYYFDGPPAFVQRDFRRELRELFGVPVAYAHPGHYVAGDARGQMLTPAELSLGDEAVALGDGVGITGAVRSARVVLSPATAPEQLPPGVVALAEGIAQQGDTTVHFHLEATADEVDGHATAGQIDGCIFEEQDLTRDGTVTMAVLPHLWFDLVDFAEVEPGSERAPTELGSDDTARIAFVLGVVQLSAYRFAYTPDP
jgi:hypothetical protein